MKFLHLGDLHLGKLLADYSLLSDQEFILEQIMEIALTQAVDGILLAGDIYDKSIPTEGAVRLFDQFISNLVSKQIKVFIISGNHDSDERLNFGSRMFEAKNVYISAKYDGELYKRTFEDAYGPVHVYLLPYVKASQVRYYYPGEEICNYDQALRVAIENAHIETTERNIIVAHQFVAGKSEQIQLAGSEGLGVQNVGTVEMVGTNCFDVFDYVALGHIHKPQSVDRPEVRYAGSMLKYSLSEAEDQKSVPVVTLRQKGDVKIELIPLKPIRDLRHIRGPLKQLLNQKNLCDTEDYIYATLTDEEMILDVMGTFQQYYPNTVKIDFDNSHTKEISQVDFSNVTKGKTFEELFCEFYEKMYGTPISNEELQFMQKIAREAGVIDETD